jgi:hypothetical protein
MDLSPRQTVPRPRQSSEQVCPRSAASGDERRRLQSVQQSSGLSKGDAFSLNFPRGSAPCESHAGAGGALSREEASLSNARSRFCHMYAGMQSGEFASKLQLCYLLCWDTTVLFTRYTMNPLPVGSTSAPQAGYCLQRTLHMFCSL